jgi:3-oxoadipyl-CoA thiolase
MTTRAAYVCDAVRTPFGRAGGMLATVRPDDLGAVPIQALANRHPRVDWSALDDVILGCSNQAGEAQGNVARMAALLAGLPVSAGGTTVNSSCGSGLEAIALAARAIKGREGSLFIAGGLESMSRAPFLMPKREVTWVPGVKLADTAFGWRFVNPLLHERFGSYSGAELAENVAAQFRISRAAQDAFAYRSQLRASSALDSGALGHEIVPVVVSRQKPKPMSVERDEHPKPEIRVRELAKLKPIAEHGSVTAGNAAPDGDGACALVLASHELANRFDLSPRARVVATAVAGVEPRVTATAVVQATRRVLASAKLRLSQVELFELGEASAAEALAVLRQLGIPEDASFVNPSGGAIALGHPRGASGARLVGAALHDMQRAATRYTLCMTSAGMGEGMAMLLERV